jgi:cysteine desulfurase
MATTPVADTVKHEMLKFLSSDGVFANPASTHGAGQQALSAVSNARTKIADVIGAKPSEIIFTSGATESNNLAIQGASEFYQRKGRHLVTVQTEHSAVLDCFKYLERQGFSVTYLKPNASGLIDIKSLESALTPETILVSVMHVNNEIGVISPIKAIAKLLRDKGIIFHVDAAQSIGKVDINVMNLDIDLMSFSAHKCYGPKGIGALYVRSKPRVRLKPLLYGGGQEQGLRAGTLATHQIVGMAEAFQLAQKRLVKDTEHVTMLRDRFLDGISSLSGVKINGDMKQRVPHNLNLSFSGVDGEALLYGLSALCVSTSSACHSASLEPSHVLRAIGVDEFLALASIRLSFGRDTTINEVDMAANLLVHEVTRLRALAQ